MEVVKIPPIPNTLQITSTINPFKIPTKLKKKGMIGLEEFEKGWQDYVGKKTGPSTPNQSGADEGYYTTGISTCVGIGILLEGRGQDNGNIQISLSHVSAPIAKNYDMLGEIVSYMVKTSLVEPKQKVVILSENQITGETLENIEKVFEECEIHMDNVISVYIDPYSTMTEGRLAVNFYPQVGSWQ